MTLISFVFFSYLTKFILHFIYLKRNLIYVKSTNTGNLSKKIDELFEKYRLFFLASIMFPIIKRKNDRRLKLIINALVAIFYISLALFLIYS